MHLLLALFVGTLVSEDLTTIAAGLLVREGELSFLPAVAACAGGIWIGDLGLWAIGLAFRSEALRWPRVARVMNHAGVRHFSDWFDRQTGWAIVGSRFAPGTRLPLYVAAGACGIPLARFALWSLAAVLLWTPILLGLSASLGAQLLPLIEAWPEKEAALLVVAMIGLVAYRVTIRAFSRRARQRWTAHVSKLWRWEFWPMWLFYGPVAAWTAWLALRHGGFRTITAANPGMPDGGVVGESKFEILSRLPREWTIPAILAEPGPLDRRTQALRRGIDQMAWTFPLVLKPDVGQRGAGVRLARAWNDVVEYLGRMPDPVIVQPYHPGPYEAGVFYYRLPDRARGRILCITDKHFPVLTGDGRSTLEDLIWAHPRYRMQAPTFLARLGARAAEVPASGLAVPLGIAGNHAQGAMFTDGGHLITPDLEARIDAIAREYEGFYIGRFDIRYSDPAAFRAGEDLAIVELNGATAECTNIYDPANSLLAAYRQLFLQWRLVFSIGAANRSAGRPVSSPQQLFELVRTHLTNRVQVGAAD